MISFRRLPIALAMAALACSAQAQSLLQAPDLRSLLELLP